MLPNACRSFLTFVLVLLVPCRNLAFASSFIVDDWDRTNLQWDGAWSGFLDQPAPIWDGTLTWGNLSGSTATLTFTGTSVQVFGVFKPVGVWSMQSQYAIDGGEPTTFVPSQAVPAEVYNQSFYDSGRLPAGEHTLKITNLGVQLWVDYFLVNDDGGAVSTVSSGGSRNRASSTATTTTTTTTTTTDTTSSVPTSTTTSSSTDTIHDSTTSTTDNETAMSTSSTSNLLTPSVSAANTSLTATTSGSTTTPIPSSATSTLNVTTPSRGAIHTGLIVSVTIAGVAIIAMLAVFLWCFARRRTQRRLSPGEVPHPYSRSSGQDLQPHFDASTYDASFRESQYSATLLIDPRLSRPASSLADLVESYGDQSSNAHRRSTDGGVTIAGGPGLDVGDAPSVSEIQSIKSRLPPVYQAYSTV